MLKGKKVPLEFKSLFMLAVAESARPQISERSKGMALAVGLAAGKPQEESKDRR
jgi:hypothetical protein